MARITQLTSSKRFVHQPPPFRPVYGRVCSCSHPYSVPRACSRGGLLVDYRWFDAVRRKLYHPRVAVFTTSRLSDWKKITTLFEFGFELSYASLK